jgi:GNAT superfamily N-acetyltransferase
MIDFIRQAANLDDFQTFAALIREYVGWSRERYKDDPALIETAFSHQSLDRELGALEAAYSPPRGKALLAFHDGAACGCVAYRRLSDTVCEMKRMFVPGRFHGRGVGRRLCEAAMSEAAADGFSVMKLDTAKAFAEAIGLYRSVGFTECAPYIDYPEATAPMIVFMEAALADDGAA